MTQTLAEVCATLAEVGDSLHPAGIFSVVAEESTIWAYADQIVTRSEYGELAPFLIDGVGVSYSAIVDRDAAHRVLLLGLEPERDVWTFRATQTVVLAIGASSSLDDCARFQEALKLAYRKHRDSGDQFIAQLALEGVSELGMNAAHGALLDGTVEWLLASIEPLPTDAQDSAYLHVKAIKCLRRLYRLRPGDSRIIALVHACLACGNYAVESEARFTIGSICLQGAFEGSNQETVIVRLRETLGIFTEVAQEFERSDGELMAAFIKVFSRLRPPALAVGLFTRACLVLLDPSRKDLPEDDVQDVQQMQVTRALAFGGHSHPLDALDELQLTQLLFHLLTWRAGCDMPPSALESDQGRPSDDASFQLAIQEIALGDSVAAAAARGALACLTSSI